MFQRPVYHDGRVAGVGVRRELGLQQQFSLASLAFPHGGSGLN